MGRLSSMPSPPEALEPNLSHLADPVELARESGPPQSALCSRCLELRLGEVLGDIEVPNEEDRLLEGFDIKIADVGQYYRDRLGSDCNLCHILSASRISLDQLQVKPRGHEDADELRVFSLYHDLAWIDHRGSVEVGRSVANLWRGRGINSLYLVVVPLGFVHHMLPMPGMSEHGEQKGFSVIRQRDTLQPEIYAPRIVGPFFDLSLASYWLRYCKSHHERLCSPPNKAPTELLLIDCSSLTVVYAPDHAEYTALSYTWGVSTTENHPSESAIRSGSSGILLPSPLPNVIISAISVTIGLGFRYLWVDRYCIDQANNSKHQQINQMYLIYRNAELTIIAAAGSGPEYGLAGINSRSRSRQPTCTVGRFEIISTLRHPHKTIQSSKWSTRGWTFQEAALSRRNLVFTEDQVYFECNAMNCHESLSSNLNKLHIEDKSQFGEYLRGRLVDHTEDVKYGHFDESAHTPLHSLHRFMAMVEQYTARDLTYDTDSLRAFTGIIRKFESSQTVLRQVWGVPLRRGTEKETDKSFIAGLVWQHKATICYPCDCDSMTQDHHGDKCWAGMEKWRETITKTYGESDHPRRRPEFPSWSWAGWAGGVDYTGRFGMYRAEFDVEFQSEVESVSIETDDGLNVNLSTYIDKVQVATPRETVRPSPIYVQALALPVSAFTYHNNSINPPCLKIFQVRATLSLSTDPWDISGFYHSLMNPDRRRCIFLGHVVEGVVFMVLEAQNDSWSRVGTILVDRDWNSREEFQVRRSRGKWSAHWKSLIRKEGNGEGARLFRIT
ncbi:heterokaryon incompatibility protein-domain-containing protein [Xylariomycetidae sp. FL2044]|nr:heterokaryon incompatibility protein-domain-containing protein [Xylariomycetidae sp. FL2044]